MAPTAPHFFESDDLFVLKHLWKKSSPRECTEFREVLLDDNDLSVNVRDKFAGPKRIWLRMTAGDRAAMRAFMDSQSASTTI